MKTNAPETTEGRNIEFKNGENVGRLWVRKKEPAATAEELLRLHEFYEGLGANTDQWFDSSARAFTVAEMIYFVIAPDHDGSRREAKDFWEFAAWPSRISDLSAGFVEGFVVGALEAWEAMKSRA